MTTDLLSRIRKHRTRPNSAATLAWFAELATLKLEACCIVLHEFPSELEARHKESELINSLPNLLNGDCSIPVKLLPEPSGNSLAAVEMRHILATIHLHNGNKLAASKALGIGRQTLYNKLSAL